MNLEEQLIKAAEMGHTETVALLLDKGVDIHARAEGALRWAAENGHTETVTLLLERGADLHRWEEETLRHAAFRGDNKMVTLLLDKGAEIQAKQDAPLCGAAWQGHTGTVGLLLEHYKTKDLEKWANLREGKPYELAVKPFAQKEYKKRMDCIKAQKARDSEPEITL
jgi:ankyrin repeat protein